MRRCHAKAMQPGGAGLGSGARTRGCQSPPFPPPGHMVLALALLVGHGWAGHWELASVLGSQHASLGMKGPQRLSCWPESLPLPLGTIMKECLTRGRKSALSPSSAKCCMAFPAPFWPQLSLYKAEARRGSNKSPRPLQPKPAPKAKKQILSPFSCRRAMTLFPIRSFLL